MKEITYIEFPSGWRPPAYQGLVIDVKRWVCTQTSNNGNKYHIMMGHISDEDATFLTLADPRAKIKDVGTRYTKEG